MPFDSRKLNPIYEALDCRNPKLAVKLCDAALKKSSAPIVGALKSVALHRMGKSDDAIALARQLAATSITPPVDDHLLSTLLITYKDTGNLKEAVTVYESAHTAEPGNTEVAHSLFAEYLRTSQFAKAQALSMKLFKGPNGAEQLFWAVTCLVLQVDQMSPPKQPNRHYAEGGAHPDAAKQLQLAAAMLNRAASQGKLTAPTHLLLLLEVYTRQQAHDEAEALLAGPHGELMGDKGERLRRRAELHERSGKHADAFALHSQIVKEHTPDDWEAHRGMLRCARAASGGGGGGGGDGGGGGGGDGGDGGGDGGLGAALEATLAQVEAANPRCRAPRLARLLRRFSDDFPAEADTALAMSSHTTTAGAHQRPAPGTAPGTAGGAVDVSDGGAKAPAGLAAGLAAVVALMHGYFESCGEKPAGTLDMLPVLAALAPHADAQSLLLSPLDAMHGLGTVPSSPELSLSWLRRHVSLSQWRLGCGATHKMPLADRLSLAASYLGTYVKHLPLSAGYMRAAAAGSLRSQGKRRATPDIAPPP